MIIQQHDIGWNRDSTRGVIEASQLRWPPGDWPRTFEVVFNGQPYTFEKDKARIEEFGGNAGQFCGYSYHCVTIGKTVDVFND